MRLKNTLMLVGYGFGTFDSVVSRSRDQFLPPSASIGDAEPQDAIETMFEQCCTLATGWSTFNIVDAFRIEEGLEILYSAQIPLDTLLRDSYHWYPITKVAHDNRYQRYINSAVRSFNV